MPAASERSAEYRTVKLEKGWQLLFNLPDFTYRGTQKSGSLTSFTYQHSSDQITLWVHLYRAKELATTDGCKDRMNEKLKAGGILGSADDEIGSRGDAVTALSLLRITANVAQGHAFTCRTSGHNYVIVQVAKMRYQPSDSEALFAMADGVTLLDPKAKAKADKF